MERVAPGQSSYVVIERVSAGELRFPIVARTVSTVHNRSASLIPFLAESRKSRTIVAHMMTPTAALAFLFARPGTSLIWSGFGADYYHVDTGDEDYGLLESATAAEYERLVNDSRPSVACRIRGRMIGLLFQAASRRATHFSAPIPNDFQVFKNRFPEFRGSYIQLNYATVAQSHEVSLSARGTNLLVGNSAAHTNNHLDVFDALKGAGLDGRQVVVPLNYGGDESYRDAVIRVGHRYFGRDFLPIIDLMPEREYTELVQSCGHVVMGHRRQQGIGNVLLAISSGLDVVLNGKSPLYKFLQERGAQIRELSMLARTPFAEALPSYTVAQKNLAAVQSFWGEGVVYGNTVRLSNVSSDDKLDRRARREMRSL